MLQIKVHVEYWLHSLNSKGEIILNALFNISEVSKSTPGTCILLLFCENTNLRIRKFNVTIFVKNVIYWDRCYIYHISTFSEHSSFRITSGAIQATVPANDIFVDFSFQVLLVPKSEIFTISFFPINTLKKEERKCYFKEILSKIDHNLELNLEQK